MSALDRYSCEEAMRRLDDFTDRELSPDEARRVEEHLATCEHCLRAYRFEHATIAEIRAKLRRVMVPPGLRARVLSALKDG